MPCINPCVNNVCVRGEVGLTATNQLLQVYTNNFTLQIGNPDFIIFDQIILQNGTDINIVPLPGNTITLAAGHSYFVSYTIVAEVLNGLTATLDAIIWKDGTPVRIDESGTNDTQILTDSSTTIITTEEDSIIQLGYFATGSLGPASALIAIFEIA